jgi:hypothetical protein
MKKRWHYDSNMTLDDNEEKQAAKITSKGNEEKAGKCHITPTKKENP